MSTVTNDFLHLDLNRSWRDTKSIQSSAVSASSAVYETLARAGSVAPKIRPLCHEIRLSSPTVTGQCCYRDNLVLYKAIQIAQSGSLPVVSTNVYNESVYEGGLMARA